LAIFGDLKFHDTGFGIPGDRTERYIQDNILAPGAGLVGALTGTALVRDNVLAIFEVEQGPDIAVTPQDNGTPIAAIAAVRSTIGIAFLVEKMHGARPSFSGSGANFYVINKILIHA
jgi:hypothetical protein